MRRFVKVDRVFQELGKVFELPLGARIIDIQDDGDTHVYLYIETLVFDQ